MNQGLDSINEKLEKYRSDTSDKDEILKDQIDSKNRNLQRKIRTFVGKSREITKVEAMKLVEDKLAKVENKLILVENEVQSNNKSIQQNANGMF